MVRSLGMSCSNLSMCQMICALVLLHSDRSLLHNMGNFDVEVSKHFEGSDPGQIERNLRKARDDILKDGDWAFLQKMMSFLLRRKPSVANFLDAIDAYMDRNGLWPPDYGPGPEL